MYCSNAYVNRVHNIWKKKELRVKDYLILVTTQIAPLEQNTVYL